MERLRVPDPYPSERMTSTNFPTKGPCHDVVKFRYGAQVEAREISAGLWHVFVKDYFCGKVVATGPNEYVATPRDGSKDQTHKTLPYAGSWLVSKSGVVKVEVPTEDA